MCGICFQGRLFLCEAFSSERFQVIGVCIYLLMVQYLSVALPMERDDGEFLR